MFRVCALLVLFATAVHCFVPWNYPPYYLGARRPNYSSYRPPVRTSSCSRSAPCYDVTMTLIVDGPLEALDRKGAFLEWNMKFGRTRMEAVQMGREAMSFFETAHGFSFPAISDDDVIDNTKSFPTTDGSATFRAFVENPISRTRLYSATNGEKSQFFNIPLLIFGYSVKLRKDRAAQGKKNLRLPAGASVVFGDYGIDQCPLSSRGASSCPESILTPHDPTEQIVIRFRSQLYNNVGLPPTDFRFFDCVGTHPVWGEASMHGYYPRDERSGNFLGREIITFPANIPSYSAS